MRSKSLFFFPRIFGCVESYPSGCNAWNRHKHKQHKQMDDVIIDNALYTTLHQFLFLWPKWIEHGLDVLCQALLVQVLEDIKLSQTHTQTHNTLKIHNEATWRTAHLIYLNLASSPFMAPSAWQRTEQHEVTQQTITHGQDTHSTNNTTWTRH